MSLIFLLSALVLGVTLVRRIPFPLYAFEAAAMAVVIGLLSWTWLAFLAVIVLPYDVALPIVVTLSAVLTLVLWRGGHTPEWQPLEGGRRAWAVWGVATAATTAMFGRLFWTHSLPRDAEGLWTAGSTWADYGAHTAFITHLNTTASLPSDLSIAAGEKITYPFLIDLLTAIYLQGGWSLHPSLFWPGVLLALAGTQLLITVGLRLFKRISVGIGGMVLALTMGSAAGAWTAWTDWRESGKGLFSFLGEVPMDYSAVDAVNAHVTNMVADAFLPQRAILFGIAVGLIVLIFLHAAREREDTRLLWPAAVLVGLMPMTHAHTFIVGGALLATVAFEAAWRTRAFPKAHAAPIALALVLAAPQLLWQQTANGRGTGGQVRLGWMVSDGESIFHFWWVNFGVLGLMLLVIPIAMRRHRQLIWLLPMLAILVVAHLYQFQPFEYDNLKLISWALLVAGFFVAYLVSELFRRHRAWLALIVPLGVLVIAPGALAITREFQLRYQFASPADIALADWVGANTPPDSVFASDDRPNNPVSTLAGRTLISAYRGWLFSYNIPTEEREAANKAAFAGRFDDPGLKRYSADYLIVSTNMDPAWGVDEKALAAKTPIWSNDVWRVYSITGAHAPPPPPPA